MAGYLEFWGPEGRELVALEAERLTLGNDASNDLALTGDGAVSRLHAVIERFAAGWSIRDLGSRNGTFVNGERITGDHALHPGDEVRVGRTSVALRGPTPSHSPGTEAIDSPPRLTPRERDVLVALCRPLLGSDLFTEPSSIRAVSEAMFVSLAAVKQHLMRLYDKFDIPDGGQRRRVQLANAALARGAVSVSDLRESSP